MSVHKQSIQKNHRLNCNLLSGLVVGCLMALPAAAQDKSSYHLFHPVPLEQMREMSTDRPDKPKAPTLSMQDIFSSKAIY